MRISFGLVAFFVICGCAASRSITNAPPGVRCLRITYLANEGVLLDGPQGRVLVDGLHRPYRPAYLVLAPIQREKAETAAGPFAKIDLVLVSHRHLDHFHAAAVRRFLEHAPSARLISSSQVVDAVRAVRGTVAGRHPLGEGRLESVPASPGARTHRRVGAIDLTLVGLRHTRAKFRDIQNLAHVIRVAGKTVLHVGDADRAADNFASLGLRPGEVDVALLPYWYFLAKSGRRLIDEVLRPRHLVAVHVPPVKHGQRRWVPRIRARYPGAIVFKRSFATWSSPACR